MFTRRGGLCVARLDAAEVAVLRQVLVEILGLLADGYDPADPVVERLFPDVYPDDPEASAEIRRYTGEDLTTGKLDQARQMLAALPEGGGQIRLGEEQAENWLRALTDVRIALGLRLGIRDDTDLESELDEAVLKDPTSPRVGQLSVYAYLTYLQESLVTALAG